MATSYDNPGGSGDRTTLIVLKTTCNFHTFAGWPIKAYNLINGRNGDYGDWTAGGNLVFDFNEPRCIDEAIFRQSDSSVHGTWQWAGSLDGSTYTNIGSTFTLGGSAVQTIGTLHGNADFYRYYRLRLVSGSISTTPYLRGFDFRIDDASHLDVAWAHPQGWGDRKSSVAISTTPAFGDAAAPFGPVDGSLLTSVWTTPDPDADPASFYWPNGASGIVLRFDFGTDVVMQGLKLRFDDRSTLGNWIIEGSANGSTWTAVSPGFTWGPSGVADAAGLYVQRIDFPSNASAFRYYRLRQTSGVSNQNPWQQEVTFALGGAGLPTIEVTTSPGGLEVSGYAPSLVVDEIVEALTGSLILTGAAPAIVTNVEMDVPAGALVLTGNRPTVRVGVSVSASPDALVVEGLAPLIFTDFRAVLPQQAALAVVEPPPPPMRLSQQATLAAGYVIPPVAVSQQAVLILVDGSPCVTERCQLWRIKRRDGVEFRYTSLDRDVRYGGQVYKSCGSLNPSASEDASTLGTVSNIELEGIISDDGITEADLYGGLFDDAYVTVDLVAWGALPESPRRLASGWTGELSQGDTGFKMEVLGAGSRLDQQALVQMVTPGCRWVFGDSRCGKDLEAMKLTGEVTGSVTRSVFGASLSGDGAGRQWENGTVRFTSGVNEGQRLEVRSVDFAAGVVNLWPSAAFRAEPGDTFDLLPGCDKSRDGGCTLYANVINHGGFPDVPGNDAILETPDAQY